MKEREKWIDLAKGIAILLVVFGHVNLGFKENNTFPQIQSIIENINFTIYSFHMPLFFSISGYLYSKTVILNSFSSYKKNIKRKIISLGVPYIVFSILYCFAKVIFSSYTAKKVKLNAILGIFVTPIEFFWYLYAIIGIFILVMTLDFVIKNKYIVLGILILIFIPTFFVEIPIIMIYFCCRYSLYFYLGKLLEEHLSLLNNRILILSSIIIFIIINLLVYNNLIKNNIILSIILAIMGSFIILSISRKINEYNILNYLGKISLQIYIIHAIVCSAVRIILIKLNINDIMIHYISATVLGIIIPVLVCKLSEKIKILDFCFSPLKYLKKQDKRIQFDV